MGISGRKIKFIDNDLIRRLGREITADPSIAKIYVNKGLAIYIDKIDEINDEINDDINEYDVKMDAFLEENNNKIFPENIIKD